MPRRPHSVRHAASSILPKLRTKQVNEQVYTYAVSKRQAKSYNEPIPKSLVTDKQEFSKRPKLAESKDGRRSHELDADRGKWQVYVRMHPTYHLLATGVAPPPQKTQ